MVSKPNKNFDKLVVDIIVSNSRNVIYSSGMNWAGFLGLGLLIIGWVWSGLVGLGLPVLFAFGHVSPSHISACDTFENIRKLLSKCLMSVGYSNVRHVGSCHVISGDPLPGVVGP